MFRFFYYYYVFIVFLLACWRSRPPTNPKDFSFLHATSIHATIVEFSIHLQMIEETKRQRIKRNDGSTRGWEKWEISCSAGSNDNNKKMREEWRKNWSNLTNIISSYPSHHKEHLMVSHLCTINYNNILIFASIFQEESFTDRTSSLFFLFHLKWAWIVKNLFQFITIKT